MKSQYTPGPWSTGADEDAHMIYDSELNAVASTLRDDSDGISEAANAQLIAAAPDLLEALKNIMTWPLDGNAGDCIFEMRRIAEEAIAKASGSVGSTSRPCD